MTFLKLFLRGVALAPSLAQGVEALFGPGGGTRKKEAMLNILEAAINVPAAIESKQIASEEGFRAGLATIVDGIVQCMNCSVWYPGKES